MEIAHLSDLHICVKNKAQNIGKTRRVIEFALEQGFDHLIISGDISHDAKAVDFEVLRRMLAEYGLLHWQKLSLAIGNHDIYGGVHLATDLLEFPRRCRETDHEKRVRDFVACFQEAFEHTEQPLAPRAFPYLKALGEVLIIGVNSIAAYSTFSNFFAANGRVNPAELEQLRVLLAAPKFPRRRKLVVMHHQFLSRLMPPPGRQTATEALWTFCSHHLNKLYQKNKLLRLFSEHRVDLVLHGHIHFNAVYRLNGVRFLNGGGAVEGERPGELRVNFITVNEDGIDIAIKTVAGKIAPQKRRYVRPYLVPEFAA